MIPRAILAAGPGEPVGPEPGHVDPGRAARVQVAHDDVGRQIPTECGEQRGIGVRIVERLTGTIERTDAAAGQKDRRRPRGTVELGGDDPAELGALLGRRAHERDRRVVDVEVPAGEPLRHGVEGAEIDHVERAQRDDLGQTGAASSSARSRSSS